MQCYEVVDYLNSLCPPEHAESWDNVGLLVGGNREISAIYVALDPTDEVIEACDKEGCEMLITHHPLIFSGLKKINKKDFVGRRVLALAENAISYFALHTNYDTDLMGDLAAEMLALRNSYPLLENPNYTDEEGNTIGIGRIGDLSEALELKRFALRTEDVFAAKGLRVFGDETTLVKKVAILPGSGKSGIDEALANRADVLVTGDIDHHSGLDAVARGLCVIDAGHYGLEHIFVEDMGERLREEFPDLRIVTDGPREPYYSL